MQKNLNNEFHSKYKYKYEIVGDEETKFLMIGGDPNELDTKLINLIRQPRKFVCLNDNIDYKLESEALQLKQILNKFYTSLFPLKSSFEVADNKSPREFSSSSHFKANNKLLMGNMTNEELNGQNESSLKFSIRDVYENFLVYIILILIVLFVIFYVFKKLFLFIFGFFKAFFSKSPNLNDNNSKRVVKTKKREHKLSNSLLQKMKNEVSEDSDEVISDKEISNIRNDSASTGIIMRSKKPPAYKKYGKKSSINII